MYLIRFEKEHDNLLRVSFYQIHFFLLNFCFPLHAHATAKNHMKMIKLDHTTCDCRLKRESNCSLEYEFITLQRGKMSKLTRVMCKQMRRERKKRDCQLRNFLSKLKSLISI